jgi:two-component system sensor histidine kinase RegB
MSSHADRVRHDVAWLPVVQWTTVALLWAVTAAAWLLPDLDLSLRAVAPFGLLSALCRTAVAAWRQHRGQVPAPLAGASLCADAALLTGLLDITGGPFNPFVVMFVPYVWVATVTLSARWGVVVAAVAAVAFSWLVLDHVSAETAVHHRLNDFPTHLFTMWFAGAGIAELVAHYIARARAALAQRQRQLDDARERALRSEHLAALTTLAAGAAHELSTPLATIAVAARELERNAERLSQLAPDCASLQEDARLIRTEVDRCRVILDGMSGRARDGTGATSSPLTPAALVELVRSRLAEEQRARVRVEIQPGVAAPAAPGAEMVQAISSLLKNAFDASDGEAPVDLRFVQQNGMVRVEVHDTGPGIAPEALRRAGEPFYTTKETGRGLGLGLFLTRSVVERAGGSLRFEVNGGTTAVLEVPASTISEDAASR